MKDVSVLGVRHVAVIVARDLLEDLPGDHAGVGLGDAAELRQHHRSPRNKRVLDRHQEIEVEVKNPPSLLHTKLKSEEREGIMI